VSRPRAFLSRPAYRRLAVRGGLAGAGLLVAATGLSPGAADEATAPGRGATGVPDSAADPVAVPSAGPLLAAPSLAIANASTSITPSFGTGKRFDVTVAPPAGSVPAGLDLSGAVFTFKDAQGVEAGTCTTDRSGTCSVATAGVPGWFPWAPTPALLPPDVYTVWQKSASKGLAAADGLLYTLTLGSQGLATTSVADASLFGHSLKVTVADAHSGQAVAGAGYSLTGPAYALDPSATVPGDPSTSIQGLPFPGAPPIPAVAAGTRTWGPATSGPDGTLTFGGAPDDWFAPGAGYTLAPGAAPSGYQPDTAGPLTATAATGDGPLTAIRLLNAVAAAPSATPASSASSTSAAPAPAPVPSAAAVPRPVAAPVPSQAPTTEVPASIPAPSSSAVAADTTGGSTPPPAAAPASPAKLATASSTVTQTGLVGIGILFVAVVFFLVLLVRRRARRG
jgi:hypothetical protein